MNKKLIVINKIGDEFRFFTKLLYENVDILCICSNDKKANFYYKKIKDIGLINSYYLINNLNKLTNNFFDNYSFIYTYGIDEGFKKNILIRSLVKYDARLILLSNKDYPDEVIKLTKAEYYLKYNLMLSFKFTIKDNFVEFYKEYNKNDLKIYFKKIYDNSISDYDRSTFIIDVEYAILFLLRKYNLLHILINNNLSVISSRVNTEKMKFYSSYNDSVDVSIVKIDNDIKCDKIITINYTPKDNYKLVEKLFIPSMLERLYDFNYKCDIYIKRMDVKVCLYEKK